MSKIKAVTMSLAFAFYLILAFIHDLITPEESDE
jgi:hypothetical protein